MKPYRLSRRAKADLDDIWAYSEQRWGVEQAADYARRKGVELAQAERWLASNLDYDPE